VLPCNSKHAPLQAHPRLRRHALPRLADPARRSPPSRALLSDAIHRTTGERVLPQGSGRTDAGVHALAQVASFTLAAPIPAANLHRALNRCLPPSIRVLSAEARPTHLPRPPLRPPQNLRVPHLPPQCPDQKTDRTFTEQPIVVILAQARTSVFQRHQPVTRTTSYRTHLSTNPRPLPSGPAPGRSRSHRPQPGRPPRPRHPRLHHLRRRRPRPHHAQVFAPSGTRIRASAHPLKQPFIAKGGLFAPCANRSHCPNQQPKHPNHLPLSPGAPPNNLLIYTVTANGFLHHMVRNLVGTFVQAGAHRLDPDLHPHSARRPQPRPPPAPPPRPPASSSSPSPTPAGLEPRTSNPS
jgi:tRNA pseudouridine38-40 synthase